MRQDSLSSKRRVSWLRAILAEANRARLPVCYNLPSMISPAEQSLLFRLARDYYEGDGVIADAGVFMGASTRSFAAGLRLRADHCKLRSRDVKPIQAYDQAVCDETLADRINQFYDSNLKAGDSFLSRLRQNIGPCSGLTRLNEGDICLHAPPQSCEILFLDVCKSLEINWHTVKSFYPQLIPGRSVLIHQDFIHPWLPWIHVTMGFFADYFEFIGISRFSSAIWLNTRPIVNPTFDPFLASGSELDRWFDQTASLLAEEVDQAFLSLARVQLLRVTGREDEAHRLFRSLVRKPEWQRSSRLHPDIVKMNRALQGIHSA